MKRTVTFGCGILGAALFISASVIGGLQLEGYSVVRQYISESYATGLPNTAYLRHMFVASGLLLAAFAFLVISILPASKIVRICLILFGVFYGLGTVATGYFPCDMGCRPDPENATLSQFIHNTAGFLAYSIVPFCLLGIGLASRKWTGELKISGYSLICGAVSLVFVLLLFGNPTGPMIGLFQRVIEGAILFWVIRTSFYVLK